MNSLKPCSLQEGAVVLLTVVLLLVIVTITTLYTGRVQSLQYRIALNSQNYMQAKASAQSGIHLGMAQLNVSKNWSNNSVAQTLEDKSQFVVEGSQHALASDIHKKLVTLTSKGTSRDGLASVQISEQALIYPLLANIPMASLTVGASLDPTGRFELGIDPKSEASLSIWSNTLVDISLPAFVICESDAISIGECEKKPLSSMSLSDSVMDKHEAFPTDFLDYLFSLPLSEWEVLRLQTNQILPNCDELSHQSKGLIWVDGNCDISIGQVVGDVAQPIILLVKEGNTRFAKDSTFYGLLVSFRSKDTLFDFDITMSDSSLIRGALVSNHSIGKSAGRVRIAYDAMLLKHLRADASLKRVTKISGSWKDF